MFPVGFAISLYRKQKALSAAAVAKKLQISRGFLSIIESGLRLPPMSLDFAKAAAEFLEIPEAPVLSSIICEHLFSELKKFPWLPSMFSKGISIGFKKYYIHQEEIYRKGIDESTRYEFYILSPADKFRSILILDLINRYLNHVAGDFIPLNQNETVEKNNIKYSVLGVFRQPKNYLFDSYNYFPLRESLVFLDDFRISENEITFNAKFHTPFTVPMGEGEKEYEVVMYISPYDKDRPIDFLKFPLT